MAMLAGKCKARGADAWREKYVRLNLCGGRIKFSSDEGEGMMEIIYADGMLIDVGLSRSDHCYYITVVETRDDCGWGNPLTAIAVYEENNLAGEIQEAIFAFRSPFNAQLYSIA